MPLEQSEGATFYALKRLIKLASLSAAVQKKLQQEKNMLHILHFA